MGSLLQNWGSDWGIGIGGEEGELKICSSLPWSMWPAVPRECLLEMGARVQEVKGRKAGEDLRNPLKMVAEREGRPQQLIYYRAGVRLGDWRDEG